MPAPADSGRDAAPIDLESFDDYDDQADHDGAPRLRLVDPVPDVSVIVELVDENTFHVSRLRHGGTTVAMVVWTRKELEELVSRAQAALEMR